MEAWCAPNHSIFISYYNDIANPWKKKEIYIIQRKNLNKI